MKLAASMTMLVLQLFVCRSDVGEQRFLKQDPTSIRRRAADSGAAFKQAMESMMGCMASRDSNSQQSLAQIKRALSPIWRALPKNGQGHVEWKLLRYLTHRYFMQQYSLLIRGLEPVRQVNESQIGVADILDKHAPSLIETVLEGKRSSNGFSFEDAAAMIGTLEQLIFDWDGAQLEKVYNLYGLSVQSGLTKQQLVHLIEVHTLLWILGDESWVVDTVRAENEEELENRIPHWTSISDMIEGLINSLEFSRQRHLKSGYGQSLMAQTFWFEDAHEIVGLLTKTFASYWESECQNMKASLESMDYRGTGRVKLSDFYGAKLDGDRRFAESEVFLRELGALDESSAWKENQVIIPNYILGVSNCIVTSEHYFVCCVNECEGILNDIEIAVGSPLAAPEEIFRTLANIATFDDESPKLTATLKHQLERVSTIHTGQVPLHGRLFAQWLHYVFPRECPFPHKTRSISAVSRKFSDGFASTEEVLTHAAIRNNTITEVSALEESQVMSQWSEEEELLVDYSSLVSAPWQNFRFAFWGLLGSLAVGARFKRTSGSEKDYRTSHEFQNHAKAHYV